ncbi:hypothetical protein [Streptomyces fuscigenes]|uniref:hypothetical protein n=1 Tax=Streptomyces fuscigenes TaxID=1528880 RepID=UPI001F16BB0D|nr:hypothetical protein [Streptomyces fuscigenes]MCF3960263.1 hypothetical protein [Streptomyces fuscigenes]
MAPVGPEYPCAHRPAGEQRERRHDRRYPDDRPGLFAGPAPRQGEDFVVLLAYSAFTAHGWLLASARYPIASMTTTVRTARVVDAAA